MPEQLEPPIEGILCRALARAKSLVALMQEDDEDTICKQLQRKQCIVLQYPMIEVLDLHAASTNTGGAGLGLAIAKEIVTAHGGTITAESNSEHTKFTVKLPS